MTLKTKLTATISAVALLMGGAGAALAQDAAPAAPAAPAQPEMAAPAATDFSETQIQAFAVAYVQVMEIGMSFEEQMQAAESDDDRMGLQMQAQEQMAAAVEGTEGITIDEYNALLTAAQSDQELAAQVQGEVDAVAQE